MDDSTAIKLQRAEPDGSDCEARWILLVHQIPPKPDYFRVKVRRRLARLGTVALKSTVYVVPWAQSALEDFQWLRREMPTDAARLVSGGALFASLYESFRD